ncbi:excinuclease ABC subunit UvrA [Candidatus Nomurabacteria bacterium]|nr:excinuclease ABC subunit UvrA [Candidatus Nomurabacteria bacterium]
MSNVIRIKNACVHNLKNVSIDIPKNKLTVITGLSGSGKSSLAFDTIYAEGQRRYAESLNAYARQFMDVHDKPDVEQIDGLSPTIAIDQKNISRNPRSTLGTTTEIYDYLRLLFARIAKQYDPETNEVAQGYSPGEITEEVRKAARKETIIIIAPYFKGEAASQKNLLQNIERSGFNTIRLNGMEQKIHEFKKFKFQKGSLYEIDVVISKINDPKKQNVAPFVENGLELGNGSIIIVGEDSGEERLLTTFPYCESTGRSFEKIEPRTFSFNSPYGACPRCTGLGYTLDIDPELIVQNPRLTIAEGAITPWSRMMGNQTKQMQLIEIVAQSHGFSIHTPVQDLTKKAIDLILYGTDGQQYKIGTKTLNFEGVIPNLVQKHATSDSEYIKKEIEQYMQETTCPVCDGKRLKAEALHVKIGNLTIADITQMSVAESHEFFSAGGKKQTSKFLAGLSKNESEVATPIAREVGKRLDNLMNVGLHYLTLDRAVNTLSGGEMQRIRLANQLSTGLTNVIYILDEPTIGLHPRDNAKLIDTIKSLRDLGNTVIVVEHDATMMQAADFVIDIGPGAGQHGGEIMASGTYSQILKAKNSLTGQYLSGEEVVTTHKPPNDKAKKPKSITITGAKANNLKNIDVSIPLGKLVSITGVSGSGKSTLINHILAKALSKHFYRAKTQVGEHTKISGIEHIDKVIAIDQTPIGRTPRSNPATYTGVFTAIRDLFASQTEAKMRGYDAGMFSFNVKGGGRCESCSGEGYVCIPMHFLNDVFIECGSCEGKRYNKEALEIHYRGKSIADVLEMTIEEAYTFFRDTSTISDKLHVLKNVGLGYLKLGQPATTLSGGEAQRIKLATELSRRQTGKTLYILDEPTTGLHFADTKRLLQILAQLVEKGNTVLTIEHNMDVIKCSDWIIDLGPEGGKEGGVVVAQGTPKDVVKVKGSHTAKYLKEVL